MMTDKLRLEQWDDGSWAVIDDDGAGKDVENWGLLAAGFPDQAEAEAWLEDCRRERQCREWEEHARPYDGPPSPF